LEPGRPAAGNKGKKSLEIDKRLTIWQAERGAQEEGQEEEPKAYLSGSWADLEEAWRAYTYIQTAGWQILPLLYPGGMMGQPELLINNIMKIAECGEAMRERKNDR
jgi:hypothetical protein